MRFQGLSVFHLWGTSYTTNWVFCQTLRYVDTFGYMPSPEKKGISKKNLFKLTYFLSFFPQRNFNPTKKGIYQILEYHETLRKLHKNYGPVVRQDIGRRTVIHAFDPDHVRSVLNADGKTPTVPPLQETTQIYREKRQLSPGLGNTYVTILSQYIFQLQ